MSNKNKIIITNQISTDQDFVKVEIRKKAISIKR